MGSSTITRSVRMFREEMEIINAALLTHFACKLVFQIPSGGRQVHIVATVLEIAKAVTKPIIPIIAFLKIGKALSGWNRSKKTHIDTLAKPTQIQYMI